MMPPSPPARTRTLRRYVIGFAIVFLAVFGTANSTPSSGLGTGANSWTNYGWPSPWLTIHTYKTHGLINDRWEHEFRFEGLRVSAWSKCLASVATCGGIAATLVAIPALMYRLSQSSSRAAYLIATAWLPAFLCVTY